MVSVRTNELRDKQAQFRECLDNILACFAIFEAVRDETGKITDFIIKYMNEAACQHYNMTAEELVGRNLIQTYSGMSMEFFPELCRVVETGKPLRNDKRKKTGPDDRSGWQSILDRVDKSPHR